MDGQVCRELGPNKISVNAWVDKSSGQLSHSQLRGKIITLEKQLTTKDSEITQLKAEVLSVQNTMEEKMKLMAKSHEDKVTELLKKTRELLNEIAQLRKDKKAVSQSSVARCLRCSSSRGRSRSSSRCQSPPPPSPGEQETRR